MTEFMNRDAIRNISNNKLVVIDHNTTPSHMKRGIYSLKDLERFKLSETYKSLLKFIQSCADAVVGKEIHDDISYAISPPIIEIVDFLTSLSSLVDDIPPIHQPMRFGNKAFRIWHGKLCDLSKKFISELLQRVNTTRTIDKTVDMNSLESAMCEPLINITDELIEELSSYLNYAFGNEIRLDYGTGHELNCVIFFYCLNQLNIITSIDLPALILRGFSCYISVMRKLQTTYVLEPAGSHGVWGLDDYHCLTFLFGAAQLCKHSEFTPNSIHDQSILEEYQSNYLYFESIYFIKKLKSSAAFAETSPMLNDISGVSDWIRVTTGLMRLFEAEVLSKLPVVQHILFGNILRCTWEPSVVNDDHNVISGGHMSTLSSHSMRPIHSVGSKGVKDEK